MTVAYSPRAFGTYSSEVFIFTTPGKSRPAWMMVVFSLSPPQSPALMVLSLSPWSCDCQGGNAPQVTITGSAVGAGVIIAKTEDPTLKVGEYV